MPKILNELEAMKKELHDHRMYTDKIVKVMIRTLEEWGMVQVTHDPKIKEMITVVPIHPPKDPK